jgi:adenosylmethionine-8-amino-7-oxononanoate aminotransferase
MAVAKGLTGGYLPLAATLTSSEVYNAFLGRYEEFKAFFHGHSYTANPLGCAAALATLSIFAKEKVLQHVSVLSRKMAEELARIKDHPHIGDIRQKGLMVGVEIVAHQGTREPFEASRKLGQRVALKVRDRSIILRPLGDIIVLMPPLSSTEEEIEHLVRSVRWAMDEVLWA